MILDALKKISGQIDSLQKDMSEFFDKVIRAQEQVVCYSQIAPEETKINSAFFALQLMYENRHASNPESFRNNFMDQCSNG
jgi:hypothetical protein